METLQVKIMTPRELVFEGRVASISSVNSAGNFDILPEHAGFLSIVENQSITLILPDKSVRDFRFEQAIIFLEANKVLILADPKSLEVPSKVI